MVKRYWGDATASRILVYEWEEGEIRTANGLEVTRMEEDLNRRWTGFTQMEDWVERCFVAAVCDLLRRMR